MLKVLEIKDAQKIVKDHLKIETETISLSDSLNRILAADVFSVSDIPQFNRSCVDGYAVNSSLTFGASQSVPAIFLLDGEIEMGKISQATIKDNHCFYVPTGGMIPDGSDAVVMIENTTKLKEEIFVYQPLHSNENTIRVGEDISKNRILLRKGTMLNSARIGLLAGAGINFVNVYKKPTFFVISTGDEIIPVSKKIEGAQIYDINSYIIETKMNLYGTCVGKTIIKDDLDLLTSTINEASSKANIVFISGGSSVGFRDYTKKAIEQFAKIIVHGLALKPGKPTMVGVNDRNFFIGLPGHPMAALVALQEIYIACLNQAYNYQDSHKIYAFAKTNFPGASGRATVMPVQLTNENGHYYATPKFYKSGLINILAQADGYIIIPTAEEGIEKNTLLEVNLL